jgi:hypothetical protein
VEREPAGRKLELATAIALGLVSLVTALGVLQASTWNTDAARLASDSADARDQSISIAVVSQLKARADRAALIEAQRLALLQDEAEAAGNLALAFDLEVSLTSELGNSYNLPEGAFERWEEAGFPADVNPADAADYLVQTFGEADALSLTSQRLGELAKQFTSRAAVFGQASLVHALALFLFGVAGINRLRAARWVTLGVGAVVFAFGLFLMSTAY